MSGFAANVEEIYQERLTKAYDGDLGRREDWASGVERGLIKTEDGLATWADHAEELVTGWANAGEDAFVRFGMTGKASIGDLVDFMLEQFLRTAFQQNIAAGMNLLMNSAVSALGGLFGGGGAAPISTNHTGSPGVMRSYRPGGFGDRMPPDEQLAMVRDGEEIMTSRALENAGALIANLPAMASRSGGPTSIAVAPTPVQVTVNNFSDAGVETEQGTDSHGKESFQKACERAVDLGDLCFEHVENVLKRGMEATPARSATQRPPAPEKNIRRARLLRQRRERMMGYDQACQQMTNLRLHGILQAYEQQHVSTAFSELAFEDRLKHLLLAELHYRDVRSRDRLVSRARFKHRASHQDIRFIEGRNLDRSAIAELLTGE